MKHVSLFVAVILLGICSNPLYSQKRNAGIGLALSGGGAKGLAHIGILKAIDSAELNIDYLSGTSMGSIVGGLYAAGYSADSIETIARNIDWNVVLSNAMGMKNFTMEEKSEFGKYAVELPLKDFKLKIPAGLLESQELWLVLEKYFFPVAGVKDFDKFSIPFRCVGTDLINGKAVSLGKGNIVPSVRSSMALPGIFSPVDIDGIRLIDGGVLRNLPVTDIKEMGAKYAIGVSVSSPVASKEELEDAFAVTTQAIFINDNKSFAEQSALCDELIQIPMGTYSSGSFDQANGIIDLGISIGRQYYPYFKRLADSLKKANPDYVFRKNRLPEVAEYKISSVTVKGLSTYEQQAFLDQIGFDSSQSITSDQLQKNTRRAFAYRMYKSITYHLLPDGRGGYELEYDVKPESKMKLKVGISENSFTGFGVQLNVTARNTLTPFSRTMLSLNLGENFRAMLEHLQMFGYGNPWSNRFRAYYESQEVPVFDNFRPTGRYALKYLQLDNRFQLSAKRRSAGGLGIQWEYLFADPKIENGLTLKG
ncbi:MAG TPA: patatin-like phospholipase family protein, partial [Phnomibacter sp.]|nr:patatin-like phospholipase family protein [Phnomibacter sp.]